MPDAPTLNVVSTPNNFQPATPSSTASYTVTVAVGSQGSVNNISAVHMCWTKATDGVGNNLVQDCTDFDDDPRYEFQMSWYNWGNGAPDDWFEFDSMGMYYTNASSVSNFGDGSASSMNMSFKFHVSEAMHMGNDWQVTITVVDKQDQTASQTIVDKSVLYFGAVNSQPLSVDYGNLASGESYTVDYIGDGSFMTNGASDITFHSGAFFYDDGVNAPYEIPLDGGAVSSPAGSGKVALDCSAWNVFNEMDAVRMSSTATIMRTGLYGAGLWEDGITNDYAHSCRLSFGGAAPVANQTYHSVFTVGIGANP